MTDPDGIALFLAVFVALACFLIIAGAVEFLRSRPSRKWIRRLRGIERARIDWAARCVESQNFWRQP